MEPPGLEPSNATHLLPVPTDLTSYPDQNQVDISKAMSGAPDGRVYPLRTLKLDQQTGVAHESKDSDTQSYCLEMVEKDGQTGVFSGSHTTSPTTFNTLMRKIGPNTIFAALTAQSLVEFTKLLEMHWSPLPNTVTVAVYLFGDTEQFKKMVAWKVQTMAHGYREEAHSHVREWVKAIQGAHFTVKIHIVLCYPWRDYRKLRGVTEPLRTGGRQVTVGIEASRWAEVPDIPFHLGLTLAAITGEKLERLSDLTEAQIQGLSDHGCRGLR
ncbi:hypothetical protein LTR35_001793 [Friedmanniomyces endolithicus]|uniref:Uncharacterized protein n=1 Tax=Friedmanniomyces endolithicus TaxID=329885 RepID=A0AAN6JCU9_9PEZI|nr:hypothetical protein LTR35_001793 [Friedmanniomyces endolithicus]KAK0296879.1 hypothetical protein LTS00_004679 [Friedmanniomyces endolithicus]KAK0325401.1 hypothetical protein LTR82_003684 [Friedmanniomyces endolithicus]KAK1011124.1 hypothetical protein LTR54_005042 [Friedmanniomyces endolithicus]